MNQSKQIRIEHNSHANSWADCRQDILFKHQKENKPPQKHQAYFKKPNQTKSPQNLSSFSEVHFCVKAFLGLNTYENTAVAHLFNKQ